LQTGLEFMTAVLPRLILIACLLSVAGRTGAQLSNGNTEAFDQLAAHAHAAMEANQVPEAIRLYTRATTLRPEWSEGWW